MKSILKTSTIAFVSALIAVWAFDQVQTNQDKTSTAYTTMPQVVNTSFTPSTTVSAMSTDFTMAAEKTIDAVVHITNTSVGRSRQPNSIWEYFYNTPRREFP